ncbi:MAG: hypothetical protein AAGD04_03555 [Pseudomonadota bacterium]
MTFSTTLKAGVAALSLCLASPVTAQSSFDLSQFKFGSTPSAKTGLCDTRSSDPDFAPFNCELVAEAMWNKNPKALRNQSRAQAFAYVSAFAKAIHDPSIVWKVSPDVYANLDPRVPRQLEHIVITKPDILIETAGAQWNQFLKGAEGFLTARDRAVRTDQMDPIGEFFALMGGMSMHHHPLTHARDAGAQDAMVWLAIAGQDPAAASQFYDGLRTLVYSF